MRTLSRNQEKQIRSLQQKKFRDKLRLFVVEGGKMVKEALASEFEVQQVICSKPIELDVDQRIECLECDEQSMKRISNFKSPPGIMAIVAMPEKNTIAENGLILALDGVQDPGNLGTIMRSADAFNVNQLICSNDTVDCFSPKVVQASMGAIFRLNISYVDIQTELKEQQNNRKLYASHLEGSSIYDAKLEQNAVLILGNESKGVSEAIENLADQLIKIPIPGKAESLNVSMAASILLSEFSRQLSS